MLSMLNVEHAQCVCAIIAGPVHRVLCDSGNLRRPSPCTYRAAQHCFRPQGTSPRTTGSQSAVTAYVRLSLHWSVQRLVKEACRLVVNGVEEVQKIDIVEVVYKI
jgi:hypothetical protein